MTAVIIILILSLGLIGLLFAFIRYINSTKGEVEPYKPTPDPVEGEIKKVDEAIKTVDIEIEKKLERDGKNESDADLLGSFERIKL
jgi:hypothetical protein